jgi:hypothetical protein
MPDDSVQRAPEPIRFRRQEVGAVAWKKVVELLVVNRLIAPRSKLSIHQKWFPRTAMSALLDSDERVAEKAHPLSWMKFLGGIASLLLVSFSLGEAAQSVKLALD